VRVAVRQSGSPGAAARIDLLDALAAEAANRSIRFEDLRGARPAYNGACGLCLPDARWRAHELSDGMTAVGTTQSRRRLAKVTGNAQYTPTSISREC